MKKMIITLSVIMCTLLGSTSVFAYSNIYVATQSNLRVRTSPIDGKIVDWVTANGTLLKSYEERDGWYRIGTNRWISGEFSAECENSEYSSGRCVIDTPNHANVNVRKGPGTSYSAKGKVSSGTWGTFIGNGSRPGEWNWEFVQFDNGLTGWVLNEYVHHR